MGVSNVLRASTSHAAAVHCGRQINVTQIAADAYVDVTLVNRSAIVNDDYNNEATDVQATDGPIDGGRQPTD